MSHDLSHSSKKKLATHMIDSIHQSTLSTFLRCGEQGRRRYVEGEKIPPGIAANRGTGVHAANEINLRQKIVSRTDMVLSDLQDAARDGFVHACTENGVYLPPEDLPAKKRLLNAALNDTIRCTEQYRATVAPLLQPVAVEEPFLIDIGLGLPLGGRMDSQEDDSVQDLKSTAKAWNENKIRADIQDVFYTLAHEKTRGVRPRFDYHVLIARRNKEGQPTSTDHQRFSTWPGEREYEALIAKIKVLLHMLKTGTFPPADPSHWICSILWCGFFQTCRYTSGKKVKYYT